MTTWICRPQNLSFGFKLNCTWWPCHTVLGLHHHGSSRASHFISMFRNGKEGRRFISMGGIVWNRRGTAGGNGNDINVIRSRRGGNVKRVNTLGGAASSVSPEDTRLTEVITIYEKLTKSRARGDSTEDVDDSGDVFRPSSSYFDYVGDRTTSSSTNILERYSPLASLGDFLKMPNKSGSVGVGGVPHGSDAEQSAKVLDFSKFRNILGKNYSYFSAKTGLLQAHTLDSLSWSPSGEIGRHPPVLDASNSSTPQSPLKSFDLILKSKQFCLSIVNPTENDLSFLGSQLHVHDLTLRDIRKENTEEKVEMFKHYMFLSLRPYLDGAAGGENKSNVVSESLEDETSKNKNSLKSVGVTTSNNIDLNVLIFQDFAIIVHHGHHWSGFKDMLGFLNLLCSYGNSPLTPDWVLFSIFIELAQDAKYCVKTLEPKILNLKVVDSMVDGTGEGGSVGDKDKLAAELSNVLTKNFENEFEIYKINRFIKPKIQVLKLLRPKCGHRIGTGVLNLLSGTRKEFEELGEALGHFSHILERSQDTCLTLANVRQSLEANQMGKVMKRISEVALLFLPLQAVAGLLGMNVKVPYQEWESTAPFWTIIMSSTVLILVLYRVSKYGWRMRRVIFNKKTDLRRSLSQQVKK